MIISRLLLLNKMLKRIKPKISRPDPACELLTPGPATALSAAFVFRRRLHGTPLQAAVPMFLEEPFKVDREGAGPMRRHT